MLFRRIVAEPEKVVKLVKAMYVLHNFLRIMQDQHYAPPGVVDTIDLDGCIRGFGDQANLVLCVRKDTVAEVLLKKASEFVSI